MIKDYNYYCH